MVIKTKYDIAQRVWTMVFGLPTPCRIRRIDTVSIGSFFRVEYYLDFGQKEPYILKESFIYPTKEELLKSL